MIQVSGNRDQGIERLKRSTPLLGRLLPRGFFEHRPDVVAPRLLGKLLVHRTSAGLLAGRIVEAEAYLGPHNEPPDPAAHAHRGPTPRNLVLFGQAGHAYVYSIYGRYFCMNVSCEVKGRAGCVLLRALEPVVGMDQMARNRGIHLMGPVTDAISQFLSGSIPQPLDSSRRDPPGAATLHKARIGAGNSGIAVARQLTSGPSRLCQALEIVRTSHNGMDLADPASPFQIRDDGFAVREVLVTPRIGINPANAAVDWPLRYAVLGNPCVSGPKSLGLADVHGNRVFIP